MNDYLKNYSIRKLNVTLSEQHTELYIVLEENRYVGTVKVDLISEEKFKLIDFCKDDGGDKKILDGKGYYFESLIVLEAVAHYVLEPILENYEAAYNYFY